MPTRTFYNLPKEKQDKLIESALKEFSRTSFHDASINTIVNDSNISRGSFYMYFTDKEDLFKYLLSNHRNHMEETIVNNLEMSKGDLKEAFIKSYDDGIKYKAVDNFKPFLDKVFGDLNIKSKDFLICKESLSNKVKDKINTDKLKKDTDLESVLELLISNMLVSLGLPTSDNHLLREQYLKKLDIICYGIYEEDKND